MLQRRKATKKKNGQNWAKKTMGAFSFLFFFFQRIIFLFKFYSNDVPKHFFSFSHFISFPYLLVKSIHINLRLYNFSFSILFHFSLLLLLLWLCFLIIQVLVEACKTVGSENCIGKPYLSRFFFFFFFCSSLFF